MDFGREDIPVLFRRELFFPTLTGMDTTALIIVIDGIFVGHSADSDGLDAVNIAAPLFMIFTGLGADVRHWRVSGCFHPPGKGG